MTRTLASRLSDCVYVMVLFDLLHFLSHCRIVCLLFLFIQIFRQMQGATSVAITTDAASVLGSESVVAITAHWICAVTWALKSGVVALDVVDESHTAERIFQSSTMLLSASIWETVLMPRPRTMEQILSLLWAWVSAITMDSRFFCAKLLLYTNKDDVRTLG